jgi:hypothetical protein
MTNQELRTQVSKVVKRYADDEIMLDALFQWGSNPTSRSAGYGLQENYLCIVKNLVARYGLSTLDAEKRVAELKRSCDSLIKSQWDIYEIQRHLLETLKQGEPGQVLRQGVLRRLRETSEETRQALLTLEFLENINRAISPDNLTLPPDRWSDYQSEFQAYFNAMWGATAPVLQVRTEIVRCGAYNELYWVPSPGAKSSPHPTLVKGVAPTVAEIEALGTKLLRAPEVPALLEKHWQNKDFDLLRLIDILSHSYGGVLKIDELMPLGINIVGFSGAYGQHVALSPVIVTVTKQYMDILKCQKMEGIRQRTENTLLAVKRKMAVEVTLAVLWTGMGEVLWKLVLSKASPLYVCLAPWLTTFGQSPGFSRIGLHEKPHVMLIIPYQSRPSLFASLEGYSGLCPSETRWEKSLSFLGDPQNPDGLEVLIGERHPLLNEILTLLGGGTPHPQALPATAGGSVPALELERVPQPPKVTFPASVPQRKESVFIGHAFPEGEPVTWEPGKGTGVRQPNRNVLIVGKPGTGKSRLIKAFVKQLEQMGIPSIALDWASEYTDVLPNAIDARKGITINPLELPLGATPYQTALEISSIIRAVFVGIGDIQEALLRNAILEAYKRKGVLEAKPDTWRLNPPTFEDVFDIVQHSDSARTQKTAVQGLLSRISPIVELKLFSGSTTIPFEQLVTRGSSILLGGLYTDELRVVFGHFLLTKLWCYVQNLGGTDLARFYLVLDEANRLAFPGSPLERLVREARKFGVGIIVASQRPRDFTDTVPANAACSIVFQCPLENDATFMAKQINCRAMDIQALEPTFDSLVKFDYAAEVRRVKVVPYLAHAQGYES